MLIGLAWLQTFLEELSVESFPWGLMDSQMRAGGLRRGSAGLMKCWKSGKVITTLRPRHWGETEHQQQG